MNFPDRYKFNKVQTAAFSLIQSDLSFLYSLIMQNKKIHPTYWVALCPYIGLIIDGVEDWIKSYNSSSNVKIDIPLFNEDEDEYYAIMRNSVKMWNYGLPDLYKYLNASYHESDEYFKKLCKPFARRFHLYDNIGVFFIDHKMCGNTILFANYIPRFDFNDNDNEMIKSMVSVSSKYILFANASDDLTIKYCKFYNKDYGGLKKLEFGNTFTIYHVLYSILCIINFVLYGIENLVLEEIPFKLRSEYLVYYYVVNILSQMKDQLGISDFLNDEFMSSRFRNAMAHYKLGVALKENELVENDMLKGLTQKYFNIDYFLLKTNILNELNNLSFEIDRIIKF